MSKIALIDYIGDSLKNGELVGHPVNVGNQYIDMLKEKYQLYSVAPENEVHNLNTDNSISLRHNSIRNKNSRIQIIINYFNEFKNLYYVWKSCDSKDILFFFNVDYALYFFLIFHNRRKVICHTFTCIIDSEPIIINMLKKSLLHFSRKKISLQLFSNFNFRTYAQSNLFVPDFLYSKKTYDKYISDVKAEKIICVGTMSDSVKELKKMVEIFNNVDYKLEIIGRFFDAALYEELVRIKNPNITIRNKFISNEEYYSLIASAKYCILPYRVSCYMHRTSGVLLESIFLKSIPIAPNSILQNNRISGIGYSDMNELSSIDFYNFDAASILNKWEIVDSDTYDLAENAKRILKEIDKIESNK